MDESQNVEGHSTPWDSIIGDSTTTYGELNDILTQNEVMESGKPLMEDSNIVKEYNTTSDSIMDTNSVKEWELKERITEKGVIESEMILIEDNENVIYHGRTTDHISIPNGRSIIEVLNDIDISESIELSEYLVFSLLNASAKKLIDTWVNRTYKSNVIFTIGSASIRAFDIRDIVLGNDVTTLFVEAFNELIMLTDVRDTTVNRKSYILPPVEVPFTDDIDEIYINHFALLPIVRLIHRVTDLIIPIHHRNYNCVTIMYFVKSKSTWFHIDPVGSFKSTESRTCASHSYELYKRIVTFFETYKSFHLDGSSVRSVKELFDGFYNRELSDDEHSGLCWIANEFKVFKFIDQHEPLCRAEDSVGSVWLIMIYIAKLVHTGVVHGDITHNYALNFRRWLLELISTLIDVPGFVRRPLSYDDHIK